MKRLHAAAPKMHAVLVHLRDILREDHVVLRGHTDLKFGALAVIDAALDEASAQPRPRVDPKERMEAVAADAANGIVPEVHPGFYTTPTHASYWKRMKVIEEAVLAGDLILLKEFLADPYWAKRSSSRDIVRRYMQNAVTALTVQQNKKRRRS